MGNRTSSVVFVVQTHIELAAEVGVEPDVVVGEGERDEGRDVLVLF